MPGCAKSALCKEILNTPGGLGDDRPLHSLMGDLIKGTEHLRRYLVLYACFVYWSKTWPQLVVDSAVLSSQHNEPCTV